MKTLYIALAAGLFLFALSTMMMKDSPMLKKTMFNAELVVAFEDWKLEHGKVYDSLEEELMRLRNFKRNYEFVRDFESDTMEVGLNYLSDLSQEEYEANYLGYIRIPDELRVDADEVSNDQALPASFTWKGNSILPPVLNQGQCGSCWAFSAAEALSSLYNINNKASLVFSPEYLVDCSRNGGNSGCNGGTYQAAFTYTATNGIDLNSAYPYTGKQTTCAPRGTLYKPNKSYKNVATNNWVALQTSIQA